MPSERPSQRIALKANTAPKAEMTTPAMAVDPSANESGDHGGAHPGGHAGRGC